MTNATGSTRLLIRTRDVSPAVLAFADSLEAISGHPAALIFDARWGGGVAPQVREAIGLSSAACSALGLYCPGDFPWRCGDYGYYLARQRFPQTRHFWMIETDVRFYGPEPAEFFRFFEARRDIDFLATHLTPADPLWTWRWTARARDASPFRCLFPVTRLSNSAIDAALARRVAHGKQRRRRLAWPNDEALIATTLLNGKFVCNDFNDFGTPFYTSETFYFGRPLDGDHFQPSCSSVQMAHPVLFGSDYRTKLSAQQAPPPPSAWPGRELVRTAVHWAAARANALSRW